MEVFAQVVFWEVLILLGLWMHLLMSDLKHHKMQRR